MQKAPNVTAYTRLVFQDAGLESEPAIHGSPLVRG